MTGAQDTLFAVPGAESPPPSPGATAVIAWSRTIHGRGDRHDWTAAAARLMDEHGPDALLPPFPSGSRSTRDHRDEIIRRVYRQAQTPGGEA